MVLFEDLLALKIQRLVCLGRRRLSMTTSLRTKTVHHYFFNSGIYGLRSCHHYINVFSMILEVHNFLTDQIFRYVRSSTCSLFSSIYYFYLASLGYASIPSSFLIRIQHIFYFHQAYLCSLYRFVIVHFVADLRIST